MLLVPRCIVGRGVRATRAAVSGGTCGSARGVVSACAGRAVAPAAAPFTSVAATSAAAVAGDGASSSGDHHSGYSSSGATATLSAGQFRVVVREVQSADWIGRAKFASLLQSGSGSSLPSPSVMPADQARGGDKKAKVQTAHAPKKSVLAWLRHSFGVDLFESAGILLRTLQTQAHRPEWQTHSGMRSTVMSRMQLESLHLWLLHVRLRSEEDSREFSSRKFIRILFDLFWAEQRVVLSGEGAKQGHLPANMTLSAAMTQLTQVMYGGWVAMDHALLEVAAQEEAAEDQPRDFVPRTAAFDSPTRRMDAPDVAMLGALWRNTCLADHELDPRHLPQLLSYVTRTIEHLYTFDAQLISRGDFNWLDPPRLTATEPLSDLLRPEIKPYYATLAIPAVHGKTLLTEGVPHILRGWGQGHGKKH